MKIGLVIGGIGVSVLVETRNFDNETGDCLLVQRIVLSGVLIIITVVALRMLAAPGQYTFRDRNMCTAPDRGRLHRETIPQVKGFKLWMFQNQLIIFHI